MHSRERNSICGVVALAVAGDDGVRWDGVDGVCPHDSFNQKACSHASLLIFNCNWAYVLTHAHLVSVYECMCLHVYTKIYVNS